MTDSGSTPHSLPNAAPPLPPLQLVRLPVEKAQAAVEFLYARSDGVMDLIAHFWERLAQTPPLARGDLHLIVAPRLAASVNGNIDISTLQQQSFAGAMLYVPKAHRADVLALDPAVARAFAAYISHQGPRALKSDNGSFSRNPDSSSPKSSASLPAPSTLSTAPSEGSELAAAEGQKGGVPSVKKGGADGGPVSLATEVMPYLDLSGITAGSGAAIEVPADIAAKAGGNGKVPIDFLTGHAEGIGWMTPLLLPAVNRKAPARQMVNVVMQLPAEVMCETDVAVRIARESDVPTLNRWRRQYKEERGILFDADLDAWVQTQRIFVYEHDKQVVAVAKFDLELARVIEIGGVYTFPEFRRRGFGARIVSDLACRIRAVGRVPTLQVDEQNTQAVRLYEGLGWRGRGKLARVWLTG